jgi:hypothetical protein
MVNANRSWEIGAENSKRIVALYSAAPCSRLPCMPLTRPSPRCAPCAAFRPRVQRKAGRPSARREGSDDYWLSQTGARMGAIASVVHEVGFGRIVALHGRSSTLY